MNIAYQPPPFEPVQVHYRDNFLIAVEKPSGLLSVPGRGIDKADCLRARVALSESPVQVVHRLDMGTSGLMLFARDAETQRRLSQMFEKRKVEKTYIAWVRGMPEANFGVVELPLVTDWPRRPRQKVDFASGRAACTSYRLLDVAADGTSALLRLKPVTGRSHQLRVHLAAIGHAILGDELYADFKGRRMAKRLMLHAEGLRLPHPYRDEILDLHSPPPF